MNLITNDGAGGWKRAKGCSGGNCIEVCKMESGRALRDSKQKHMGQSQPFIALTTEEWDTFTASALGDQTTAPPTAEIQQMNHGDVIVRSSVVELRFDRGEWAAFVQGLAEGDFS